MIIRAVYAIHEVEKKMVTINKALAAKGVVHPHMPCTPELLRTVENIHGVEYALKNARSNQATYTRCNMYNVAYLVYET